MNKTEMIEKLKRQIRVLEEMHFLAPDLAEMLNQKRSQLKELTSEQ